MTAAEIEQLQARIDWLETQVQHKNEVISHLLDKMARQNGNPRIEPRGTHCRWIFDR